MSDSTTRSAGGTTPPPTVLDITGPFQRAAWYARTWPPVEEVRPGIWSIPVPVPGNPVRYTLSYALTGDDGQAMLIDPGWDSDEGWVALKAGLAKAGLTPAAIAGVVITHVHPDHHGMTGRLRSAGGRPWIAAHPSERRSLLSNQLLGPERASTDAAWRQRVGVPTGEVDSLTVPEENINIVMSMLEPDVLLDDGDLVPLAGRRIVALWTPGHTPGHLCLLDMDDDVIFTGDHVLPRISPNVGLQPHSAAPPLGPYLSSLRKLADIDVEVLPAHEWRFRGLSHRVAELLEHHARRCEEVMAFLCASGPTTAWRLAEQLSWAHGWPTLHGVQRRSALAETLAHLEYLAADGAVVENPPFSTGERTFSAA